MQAFHNTPTVGYIAWQDVHIQYKGVTYSIPDGNTNKRYVLWRYADPYSFYGSDEFPTLGPEDLLVFLNKNGTYAIVPKTQIVDGSLIVSNSILTDALAANSITADKVAAGAISADKIAANAIGATAIAAGAVVAEKIAAGVIATNHLAALAVTADKIAANAVTADKIKAGAISADKLSVGVSDDIQGAKDTANQAAADAADAKTAASGPVNADSRPVGALSNQITLDSAGLKMKPTGAATNAMLLDSRRLAFWDQNGDPAIAVGDVMGLPDTNGLKYGLAIWQGEIRASQAVLSESLSQLGTTTRHLANGGVTLAKLSDVLSVTIPDRFQLHTGQTLDSATSLTNPGFESGDLTGWTGTGTVVNTYPYSGTYAVNKPDMYQDAVAAEGQVWVAQAWVKPYMASHNEKIVLQFLNASKAVLGAYESPVASTGQQYELLRVTATAPANTAYARLVLKYGSSNTISRVDDCLLAPYGISTQYTTFASATISQKEACEQIKVNTRIDNPGLVRVYTRVSVNGTVILETDGTTDPVTVSATQDVRVISGDIVIQVQARASSGTAAAWNKVEIMQNQRLPLRGAAPRYAVTSASESSCGTTCEASCQATCQKNCESSCQSTCQDTCQTACQSTCEQTSQGGGCWVEGTPVTVYDPGAGTAREIPVENLKPGMVMPYYDTATDTLRTCECVDNRSSLTHTVYVAEVEGGYTLEMTGEQPMDVLRDMRWLKMSARYLRVGDQLVRPYDGTLHGVLKVAPEDRALTTVFNPRTTAGRYIVHGFADAWSKT